MDHSKLKICYVINTSGGKSYWTRIGVAFVHRDGSLNVKLNALPINGEMHIRDSEPRRSDDFKPPPDDSQLNLTPTNNEDWDF